MGLREPSGGLEELAGPEPIQTVERRPEVNLRSDGARRRARWGGERVEPPADEGPNVNLLLADAVRHLEAREPDQAMAVLEACRELPCWEDVSDSWAKARDTLVFSEKEALARRFLELRTENDPQARRGALLEIQQALSVLRATWPDSAHADDVERQWRGCSKNSKRCPNSTDGGVLSCLGKCSPRSVRPRPSCRTPARMRRWVYWPAGLGEQLDRGRLSEEDEERLMAMVRGSMAADGLYSAGICGGCDDGPVGWLSARSTCLADPREPVTGGAFRLGSSAGQSIRFIPAVGGSSPPLCSSPRWFSIEVFSLASRCLGRLVRKKVAAWCRLSRPPLAWSAYVQQVRCFYRVEPFAAGSAPSIQPPVAVSPGRVGGDWNDGGRCGRGRRVWFH